LAYKHAQDGVFWRVSPNTKLIRRDDVLWEICDVPAAKYFPRQQRKKYSNPTRHSKKAMNAQLLERNELFEEDFSGLDMADTWKKNLSTDGAGDDGDTYSVLP
jgi:hypothetical protein